MFKEKIFLLIGVYLFLFSFALSAETCLKPNGYDINYDNDFKGYVSKNRYEEKGKILYTIYTVESGPYLGVQLFCNSTNGKNTAKDLPDSCVDGDGVKYYVYDYGKYWVYHNLNDEFLIIF